MIGFITLALLGQMNVRAKITGPVDAYGNVLVRCVNCSSGSSDAGVSAPASTVAVSNFPASQPVTGTFWPQTQPVSGTFWQTTQPVSGPLTDTQLRASAVPVSGTFWPNTQPISGSVSVSNFPATQPVSVSNFPATQPVSGTLACTGPVTDTQLRASAVPVSLASVPTHAVTGTFFQSTQPVSIASMPSTPVTGTFWQATQPVSGSVSVSNFPASQAVTLATAPTTPVTGTFWQATQPVSGTLTCSGPLTDTQLRATPVPVSLSSTTITGAPTVAQSGTWTVQPGNTPNTTAWVVRGDYTTGKTNTMKTGSLASSATTADQVVLTYTVTTGKTFYLQYMAVNGRLTTFAATATLFGECSLESPAGTKLVTTMLAGPGLGDRDYLPFTEPVPIAAGVVIRIVCTPAATTAFTFRGNFGGYER